MGTFLQIRWAECIRKTRTIIDRLIYILIDGVTDWLMDWWTDWLINCFDRLWVHQLTDGLTYWFVALTDQFGQLIDSSIGWKVDLLAELLVVIRFYSLNACVWLTDESLTYTCPNLVHSVTVTTSVFTARRSGGRRSVYWVERNQMERRWRWRGFRSGNSGSRKSHASASGQEHRYMIKTWSQVVGIHVTNNSLQHSVEV